MFVGVLLIDSFESYRSPTSNVEKTGVFAEKIS
jgi:hypothetical protein